MNYYAGHSGETIVLIKELEEYLIKHKNLTINSVVGFMWSDGWRIRTICGSMSRSEQAQFLSRSMAQYHETEHDLAERIVASAKIYRLKASGRPPIRPEDIDFDPDGKKEDAPRSAPDSISGRKNTPNKDDAFLENFFYLSIGLSIGVAISALVFSQYMR